MLRCFAPGIRPTSQSSQSSLVGLRAAQRAGRALSDAFAPVDRAISSLIAGSVTIFGGPLRALVRSMTQSV